MTKRLSVRITSIVMAAIMAVGILSAFCSESHAAGFRDRRVKGLKAKAVAGTMKISAEETIASKKFKLTWTKMKKASGYQIAQTEEKAVIKKKLIKKNITSAKMRFTVFFAGSGHGNEIEYKIRAYKMVNGKKVWSKWTKVHRQKAFTKKEWKKIKRSGIQTEG